MRLWSARQSAPWSSVRFIPAPLAAGGMTMVVVTHELGFAREVADRVMFMDRGQVVETSDPETFFSNAREERSRRFLNQMQH